MPKIIGGILVRNEANRYLHQVMGQFAIICDHIVVVDDCSNDNTIDICMQYCNEIHVSEESLWEKNEVKQRKRLFDLCSKHCESNDWILIMDADEFFDDSKNVRADLKTMNLYIDVYTCRLFDMWDLENYRDDDLWTAHKRFWPFAVRFYKNRKYKWNETDLHCGRFPKNAFGLCGESRNRVKHVGWATKEDREIKYERYMRIDGDGKFGILEQYKSILDENPNLVKF